MDNEPVQSNIDGLRDALLKLEQESLPTSARALLERANRSLGELIDAQEQRRLAALYGVSQVLGKSLDLDEVLTQVMDAVIGLTGAERGFLVLLDSGTGRWQLRAARNISQETLKQMEVSRTVLNTVIKAGDGVVTTDAQTDPRFSGQDSVVLYALRSIMCTPLRTRGKMIGAIYVDNRAQVGMFTRKDLELLDTFAVQAAIAIENARLYTQTDRALAQRVGELETLAQVDRELNTRLDFDHVMEITHKWILRVGNANQAWILLRGDDDSRDDLLIAYPEGYDRARSPLIQRSMSAAAPEIVPPGDGTSAGLVIPILHGGKSIGVIILDAAEAFSEADIEFLLHVSGRAAAAIANARLYQAVQQANQAKSKFVSVVTHELRIPMTSIKGYTDLLRQGAVGPVNEQQANFLDVVRNNVERMSALVSDLSDISRIETGRLKLDSAPIPVHGYIEETLQSLKPKMEEKEQTLVMDIVPDLPRAFADPNRLMQILTNLVSNAWKYTPNGGQIRILANKQGEFVRVEVIDNGIGISEEDQAKMFTQFFRSEDPKVREEQGWGLGLNVARRLVDLMGGSMGFSSALGEGSTFWFTLPVSEDGAKP
jgi:signal transduction histidine kinase